MVGQSAACGLAALALALQGAAAQSLFGGGATGAASSKCSLASYETRSAEVNDVCCPDPAMCATGATTPAATRHFSRQLPYGRGHQPGAVRGAQGCRTSVTWTAQLFS